MQPLIPPFIQQRFDAGELHGELLTFTLNIDLSGFTPLTESLMQEGPAGAERLSLILNEIFEPLVGLMYAAGGFIPYFAGDAFTAIFVMPLDRRHALHLLRTAECVRQLFRERESKFGDSFHIGVKAGLAAGKVEYGIVGNSLRAFYFRGPAIDAAASCQSLAGDQDIVINGHVHSLIEDGHVYVEQIEADTFRVAEKLKTESALQPKASEPIAVTREVATLFLPPEVVRYDQAGEFRSVVSCFLSFDAVRTHEELDFFATEVLDQVRDFGGYFKEIDYGDKGALMTVFFGAPVSYENIAVRAVEFALVVDQRLQQLARQQDRPFCHRMGMTIGRAFTGIVGGKERAQYACVGSRVNLAARIMASAEWGLTLVDEDLAATPQFRFAPRGKINYRGFSKPIPSFALEGRRQLPGKPNYGGAPVGRDEEIERLLDFAAPLAEGHPAGIAYVFGEAGIGKSRLTHEVRQRLSKQSEHAWLMASCDQILRKAFNPFVDLLRRQFQQSPEVGDQHNEQRFRYVIDRLKTRLEHSDHPRAPALLAELDRTQSILAAQIGIAMPGSLWTRLDAQGRYQNTIDAIATFILARCCLEPTVVEMEDIHWIDNDSQTVCRILLRRVGRLPLMVIATARPDDDGNYPRLLAADQVLDQIDLTRLTVELGELSPTSVREFAENLLGGPITEATLNTLLKATNSNPFYLEQILEYFRESKLFVRDAEGRFYLSDEDIQISTSISAILTARIDRLSDLVRETVKAAAVIGREFDVPVLHEVMRKEGDFATTDDVSSALREQIRTAERSQIWSAMNELRYIFRHSLLREAVYNMQLTTRLQQLHRQIAQAIEKLYANNIEERYIDLAFHYEQSGNTERTIEYLGKAASYARANYQNRQALDLYDRLINKLHQQSDSDVTVNIYLSQGGVYEIVGRWKEARQSYEQAHKLAKSSRDVVLLGRTNNYLGQLHTLMGEYEPAMEYLKVAAGLFESVDDMFGLGKAYSHMGHLFFRTNHYDKALDYYRRSLESGLSQAGTTTSANTISHLGLTYMNLGRYEEAIKVISEQIPRHKESQDSMGLATLHTNLGIVYFEAGDYDLSQEHHERGLQLARELGNRRLQAIGLGSLGSISARQGNYQEALKLYRQDLRMCQEIGDRQGIAVAEGLIGDVHSVLGNFTQAINHLDRCLSISSELGYRKGVAKAVNTLGDIYYLQSQHERSIKYYDQAIEIARTTNNRLVLGASLYEKGMVLLADGQLKAIRQVEREALEVAEELQNPDVLFGARLLHARCLVAYDAANLDRARSIIRELLSDDVRTTEQRAEANLAAWQLSGHVDESSRVRALELYEGLYAKTPKYIYDHYLKLLRPPERAEAS